MHGAATGPCFRSWLFRSSHLGFWSLYILLSIICPNYACTHLFSVPYAFFVFCHPRRHLSKCKQCTKGLRSQVPAYLNSDHMGPPCMGCPPLPWCSGYQIPGLREHLSLLTTPAGPCRDIPLPLTKAAVIQSGSRSVVSDCDLVDRCTPGFPVPHHAGGCEFSAFCLPAASTVPGETLSASWSWRPFPLELLLPSLSSESDSLAQCLHFPPAESGEPSPGVSTALTQTLGLAPYTGIALQLLRNSHITCQLSSSSSVSPCIAVADL